MSLSPTAYTEDRPKKTERSLKAFFCPDGYGNGMVQDAHLEDKLNALQARILVLKIDWNLFTKEMDRIMGIRNVSGGGPLDSAQIAESKNKVEAIENAMRARPGLIYVEDGLYTLSREAMMDSKIKNYMFHMMELEWLENEIQAIIDRFEAVRRSGYETVKPTSGTIVVKDMSEKDLDLMAEKIKKKTNATSAPLYSKAANIERLRRVDDTLYDEDYKATALEMYDMAFGSSDHKLLLGKKIEEGMKLNFTTRYSHDNALTVTYFARKIHSYVTAIVIQKPDLSDITMIALATTHFSQDVNSWWMDQDIPRWHPLRHHWATFVDFLSLSFTPEGHHKHIHTLFHSLKYTTDFETWVRKLEDVQRSSVYYKASLKGSKLIEPPRDRLDKVVVYAHIDNNSPPGIREKFHDMKYDHDTPLAELITTAAAVEALENDLKVNKHSNYNAVVDNAKSGCKLNAITQNSGTEARLCSIESQLSKLCDYIQTEEPIPTWAGEGIDVDVLNAVASHNEYIMFTDSGDMCTAISEKDERLCFKCGKPGHFARNCPSPDDTGDLTKQRHFATTRGNVGRRVNWAPTPRPYNPSSGSPGSSNGYGRRGSSFRGQSRFRPKALFTKVGGRLTALTEEQVDRLMDGVPMESVIQVGNDEGELFVLA